MDITGKTRILGGSLVRVEDAESFKWLFSRFLEAFVEKPAIIFTDGDAAMKHAIAEIFVGTMHLLCIFHLWKNFYEHVHHLFARDPDGWRTIASWWWSIAKRSDKTSISAFEDEWNKLKGKVSVTCALLF